MKWKFWILMVSSERSSSDLPEYILSEKNQFLDEKLNLLIIFFEIIPKYSDFVNSDDCIGRAKS